MNAEAQSDNSSGMVWPRPRVAWFMVGVLVVAFVFSIADRIIIALLVEPIKVDLELTDSDMGLMMGPAFALFYALMGLPIGRAVDKHSRRAIVGAGIFLWSIMTALCGLSRNFWELFLARVGVGVGEATLSPAAYSMIADSFPKEKLGKALGVYQSGAFFGVGFALIFGGLAIQFAQTADNFGLPLVGEVKPWQLAFIAVGLPGVLVAAIMFLVKEPIRQGIASVEEDDISLGQAFRFAFRRWRVFIAHYTGFALLALPMTTLATWVPSYLIRVVGMTPPETGFKLGLIVLIFSPVGVIFGGALADSLFKKGYTDAALRVAVGAALFMIPVSFLATTMDSSASLALALACPFAFGASISMGLAPTALQLVTPNRLRGQIGAAWMLFLNIITAALGPWAVGVINDAWFGDPLAVGQSIAAVNTFAVLVGGIVLRLTWAPFRKAVEQQSID